MKLTKAPLFVARQTGTSVQMTEEHYGGVTMTADAVDALIQKGSTGQQSGTTPGLFL